MTAELDSRPPPSVLEGILERVVYCNEENAWSVVRLEVPGKRGPVTAVGNLLGVQPGESLRLHGQWVKDKKYGEQFRVDTYVAVTPATLVGIKNYLGSGMVRGIGKALAGRLVASFGLDTLDVIENHSERLTEVEGIGPVRSARIRAAWAEQGQIKEVMVFLQSHGVTSTYAVKIFKRYGERAIAVVRANPYRLAVDIWGIGFKTADKIAINLGIPTHSPRRAEAGVVHVLGELTGEGHVYYPRKQLVEAAAAMLEIEASIIEEAVDSLELDNQVVLEPMDTDQAVYLKILHVSETGAASHLRSLIATAAKPIRIGVERAIRWFIEEQKLNLAEQQRTALRRAMDCKALVITGGPGTGKTTIINGIIRILAKKGRRILLAAPTGRAAKRLSQATGREAKTIHRLLAFSPKLQSFERNQDNPLRADILIVDEMSMVDISLFYHLLMAVPLTCQLILVGDVDQLPSVGPGSVLGDLIRSGALEVVTLTEIFRQAEESLIVDNAHRVNAGKMPRLADTNLPDRLSDFYFVALEDPEKVLSMIKELVSSRIPDRFGLDPIDDIQVLSPMHRGTLGAANLNSELQTLLNPKGESIARGSRQFRMNDKVMQIRNNYDLDVFNGDIGRVTALDVVERQMEVRFDERLVTYDTLDLDELVLAYACSIHKSQGSEYPAVVIPVHTQHYVMLQRNLLYTGITRAERLVVLVGTWKAMAIAIKNNRVAIRHTRLRERLVPDA